MSINANLSPFFQTVIIDRERFIYCTFNKNYY